MDYSFDYLIEKYPEDIMDILDWREKIMSNAVKACFLSMLFGAVLTVGIFFLFMVILWKVTVNYVYLF